MNIALLIAGGSGARMHQNIPKQFLTVNAGYVNALSPRSCYPLSKRTTENLCVSYWKQYGGETVIVCS